MPALTNTSCRSNRRPAFAIRPLRRGNFARGVRWRNCGSIAQQNQLESEEASFYQTLTSAYQTQYAGQQSILSALTSEFSPILAAGPSQEGFSPQEATALSTQAENETTAGAQSADVALGAKETAEGGDAAIPSGAQEQLNTGLEENASNENAGLQEQITEANYAQGEQDFDTAATALGESASLENPTGVAGATTNAGTAAGNEANAIQGANDEWISALGGIVGGLGSAAIGDL